MRGGGQRKRILELKVREQNLHKAFRASLVCYKCHVCEKKIYRARFWILDFFFWLENFLDKLSFREETREETDFLALILNFELKQRKRNLVLEDINGFHCGKLFKSTIY